MSTNSTMTSPKVIIRELGRALGKATLITLKSNARRCSDCFSVQCFNGDRVHDAFALDTCVRDVMSYVASTIGIDGAAIRDLMVDCLEARFGKIKKLPYKVQWLSDNGPQYTSHDTVHFGRSIGLEIFAS